MFNSCVDSNDFSVLMPDIVFVLFPALFVSVILLVMSCSIWFPPIGLVTSELE